MVELVAPDISAYIPVSNKKNDTIGGGGGGGDRDKLQAPKGKLPKLAMEQFTPPAVVIRNENPKLAMEPTVVIPPNVESADGEHAHLGRSAGQDRWASFERDRIGWRHRFRLRRRRGIG